LQVQDKISILFTVFFISYVIVYANKCLPLFQHIVMLNVVL